MKKVISLLLVMVMALSLIACGAPAQEAAPVATEAPAEAPSKAPAAAPATPGFTGKYVVDAQYVIDNLGNENVVLVDARGEDVAKDGTVEGAIAVVWQMFADVTSGAPGDPMWGTLLPAEALSEVLSATGIAPEKEIIVFGANQFGWGDEGRIVWGLNAAGFENAKFVDGGYVALEAAGAPIVKGAAAYSPAKVSVTVNEDHMINTDALVASYNDYVVIDTRADEEWNGEVLYGEAAGGHLPNALHIRYTDMFNEDQTLKTNEELEAMFSEAGLSKDQTIVTYCTGGIRSAYMQLVLEMLGYENSLNYDESFYRWAACQDSVIPGSFEGKYVVDAQYVIDNMKNENVVLVDARGEDAAKEGTLEGAIAVVWQMFADVSGATGDPMWGTLLPADKLSEVLSTTGIAPEKEIIVFGANQFGWGDEGRIVWGLNAAGFENAKFVDGGYTALVAAGAPIVKGASAFTPAEVTVTVNEDHMINTDALVADYDKFVVVDTRADEEWNGEVLYGEASGGHLPKAVHIRYTDMFNADETLKGNDELMAMFNMAGLDTDDTIVTYCTGGIRSAYMQLVLEMLGFENTLNYDESFYRWSACQDSVIPGTVTERTVYVDAEYVKSVIDGNAPESENYLIVNVAYPATAADFAGYGEGHIPGAVYASIMEVEDATGDNVGAYNLLSAEEIRDYALSHGITKDTNVILYGPDISGTARQAFGYLYIGVENVKILNGGIEAWTAAGYEVETTENAGTAATDFGCAVPANPQYWTSIEDAKAKAETEGFKLVSIRSDVEWLGVTSGYGYMDKAGEPKGAVWGKGPLTSGDVALFTNEDGTVKTLDDIRFLWADCDFDLNEHLAFYCGTGWRACVPFFMMYQEGYDNISVFDGGWYQWLMDDSNPVQVGDPASADVQYTTVGELPTGMATK